MKFLKYTERHQNTVLLVLIILIIASVNVLGSMFFARMDLTKNGRYSVSEGTKNLVSSLDDVITIRTYFSEDLPSHLIVFSQQVNDILDEYRAFGKGNVKIEAIAPSDTPEFQREMQMLGIPQVQLNVVEKDAFQVKNVYLGMQISFSDKSEVIPVVQSAAMLEYDISSAITKLSQVSQKTIGFTQKSAERSVFTQASNDSKSSYTQAAETLSSLYNVREAAADEGKNLFTDIDTLVVVSPENMDEKQKFAVDQYLAEGGNAILLMDMLEVRNGLEVREIEASGLEDILAAMGISIEKAMVADRVSDTAAFSRGNIQYILPYAFWPKLVRENFSQENPMVSSLESIVLPWSSPLVVNAQSAFTIETLATTFEGWKTQAPYDIDPNNILFTNPEALGKIPMIVLATGKYKSVFSEDKLPVKLAEGENFIAEAAEESKILVVGNSSFVSDKFAGRFPQNFVFFANAVDYLTLGEHLMGIRTKSLAEMPIRSLSETQKMVMKVLGVWLAPAAVAAGGAVYLTRRSRRKYRV